MGDIHGKVTTSQRINGSIDNDVKNRTIGDYNYLRNLPSIEGETLKGNKKLTDFGVPYVFFGTVEQWNERASLIGTKDAFYIYTDYEQDEFGNNIPGIKIGDGLSYLIDAPFIDHNMQKHILDDVVHISQNEREFWNNKVSVYIDPNNVENLVFTNS